MYLEEKTNTNIIKQNVSCKLPLLFTDRLPGSILTIKARLPPNYIKGRGKKRLDYEAGNCLGAQTPQEG